MQYDKDRVIIVGAGVVGLCVAWHLLKSGRPVTIIERDSDPGESCSYGNAGMIVPSHFVPLSAPGVIGKGLKWLANPEGPFYIRPRLNADLLRWLKIFAFHSTQKHVDSSVELIRDLNLESRRLFHEMAEEAGSPLTKKGLLMLCNTEKGLEEEASLAEMANRLGVDAEVCDAKRISELDGGIEMNVKGGVWFKSDCHLDPRLFVSGLRSRVKEMGAEFIEGAEVTGLRRDVSGAVSLKGVETPPGLEIVLACGAWSGDLIQSLGHRMPMQAGKGYSMTLTDPPELPELCSILCEAKVAVTPMGKELRFGGTMEICGNDRSVNKRRVKGIVKAVSKYFPAYGESDFEGVEPWAGLRPCAPDGLPYIGKLSGLSKLTVASGHGMMGLSLGPVTGSLVKNLVNDEAPCIDVAKLNPLRFN